MGGTLIRLVEDRHEVHVAYMTSGNIAVFDHDAQRIADLVTEFNRLFGIDDDKSQRARSSASHGRWRARQPGEPDSDEVLTIKALIRWSEAKAGAIVGRLPRRAPALSRPAVLSHRHDRQEADRPTTTCGSFAS